MNPTTPVAVSAPIPFVAVVALLGLAIGSFLNVVIYRVPRGESLVAPGSHCPSCDTPIKGRHNVPVVSWLALRGRCAGCRCRISVRYPLVEAGTAALFVGVTLRFGLSPQLPAYLYLSALAVVLAMIDVDVRRLPDSIVVPSYVVSGLLLIPAGAANGGWWTGERAAVGMLSLLAIFFCLAIALPTEITFSDVKLAGLLGMYLGWMSWEALFIGVVAALAVVAFSGKTLALAASRRDRVYTAVPVAPCLLGATVFTLFLAAPVTGWYPNFLAA